MKAAGLKKQLISAVLVLVMAFSSLAGTTFAWFTDMVSSSGNMIQSGRLDAEMYYSDSLANPDWKNAKDSPVFTHDNWEPGYTDIKYIKVKNEGTLSFKWRIYIESDAELTSLADVIDVYFVNPVTAELTALDEDTKVGILSDAVEKHTYTSGVLLPLGKYMSGYTTGETTLAIAMHMHEEAGNEYQTKEVGDFSVKLIATQFDYENDSFGGGYDSGANFPAFKGQYTASTSIALNGNNTASTDVTAATDDGVVSVFVPQGTLFLPDTNKLTVSVSSMKTTGSNLTVSEDQNLNSVDVHVNNVDPNNTTPIIVTIEKLVRPGLNIGNYDLYHVEGGNTVKMTNVATTADLLAHNQFVYDPATGNVTMALCTFSEVAVLADTTSKWEGEFDYSWYENAEEGTTEYNIANADQLAAFGAIVGGMNGYTADSFAGKIVTLLTDIDLNDIEAKNNPDLIFYPIGYYNSTESYEKVSGGSVSSYYNKFSGTFDGNGNTIANFYQNTWEMFGDYNDGYSGTPNHSRDGMGLFGNVYGGTVKNLTVSNFTSDGEYATTGVIAAYADSGNGTSAIFENIEILNCNPRVYNIGNGGIVGCVGWYSRNDSTATGNPVVFRNITVDQSNKISALWGSYDVSCGGILGQYYPDSQCGIEFENCHVAAIMDVNNDVCGNYQYYWYRYSGMLIGTIRANKTENGYTVADTTGITVTDCTYTIGDWNEYWYCELVKNSKASYTHDHQFSRLTKISSISEIQDANGNWNKEGNFVIPEADNSSATCYHIFKNSEGNLYQHFHDVADESNPDIYETFDLDGDGELNDLKEDRQCYYIPFAQVFNGLGYGVKPTYEIEGLEEIKDGTVKSVQKFKVKDNFVATYRPGTTVKVGDIFEAIVDDTVISKSSMFVAVSPATESDSVSATYKIDFGDWKNSTITFADGSEGSAKLVITDYFYCTKTVVYLNPEQAKVKFDAQNVGGQLAYTTIALGTLFKNNVDITANVTATVTDPNGTETTINTTASNWASETINLTKDGTWTVVIEENDEYCAATTTTFTVNKVDKFESKFTGDFLYRVGNANTVAWTSLFADLSNTIAPQNLNVTVVNVKGDAAGTFTNGAIQFTGTGVVKVTISADGANPVDLNLEVVNATNVTKYSELKEQNSVLLADITMSSGGTYRLTGNKVLYGNGFTFDVKNGAYAGVEYDYASYVIYLENSRLDNVRIVGAVYPEVGATKTDNYNRAIVMTGGDSLITNSFISNGASPIRNGGNLELVNTTLKGGAYANLDLRNGHLILDNVTTINQANANDKYNDTTVIVGMGIVVYQEGGSDTLKITIRNGLTQYNYLSKTEADEYFTDTYSKTVKDVVFGNDFAAYQNNGLINFGIISMNNYVTAEDIVDERSDKTGYFGTAKTITLLGNSRDCYVYSAKPATTSASEYSGYQTAGQGVIAPTVEFDFDANYVAKTEGSNDYCYAEGNTVYVSMDEGDSFDWKTSILTANKYGEALEYTVTVNGVDYTGKSISFDVSNEFEVVYAYSDPHNYTLESGEIESFEKNYTKTVIIIVSVIKPEAKNAVFSFGANGTAYNGKTILIGDKTYVMPDVTATESDKIGSTTVNGTTVYYPITEMYTSDKTTSHKGSWYACFPIFKDAVQIIDYADKGTGDPVTYNQTNVTTLDGIPSTLKATNPTSAFLYSMNSTNYPPPTTPSAVNGAVCYTCNQNGLTASNERSEMTVIAEYTYTDNAGKVYYYYVGYHCAEQTNGCVTPDTLITLADGTQVRVDSLTGNEELLVWNMETGKLDKAPLMFVDSDAAAEYQVIKLRFSDGTEVKVIGEHGFWDYNLNKYVYLDENAADYIGHTFAKQNGDSLEKVQLVDVVIETELTEAWSPVTAGHLCYFVNGMLSMPGGVGGLFNIFEVDAETMTYDYEAIERDIETYGLYTYEELNALCPLSEKMFNEAGGAYLKISIGKGNLTEAELFAMINRYSKFFE